MSKRKQITVVSVAIAFVILIAFTFVGSAVRGNAWLFFSEMFEGDDLPKHDLGLTAEEFKKSYNDSLTGENKKYQWNEAEWKMNDLYDVNDMKYYDVVFSETERMNVLVNEEEKVMAVTFLGEKKNQKSFVELFDTISKLLNLDLSQSELKDVKSSLTDKEEDTIVYKREKSSIKFQQLNDQIAFTFLSA